MAGRLRYDLVVDQQVIIWTLRIIPLSHQAWSWITSLRHEKYFCICSDKYRFIEIGKEAYYDSSPLTEIDELEEAHLPDLFNDPSMLLWTARVNQKLLDGFEANMASLQNMPNTNSRCPWSSSI